MFVRIFAAMAALIVTATLAVVPASAHHSMAGFDKSQTVAIEGVVKEFSWQNPHCFIEVEEMKDGKPVMKDGKPVSWNFEMTAPGYLTKAGWKKTSVQAGQMVTVRGNPLRTGEPGALFVSVTLPDGTTLGQNGPAGANGKGKGGPPAPKGKDK